MGQEHSTPFGAFKIIHSKPARIHIIRKTGINFVEIQAIRKGEFDRIVSSKRITLSGTYDLILLVPSYNVAIVFRGKGTMMLTPNDKALDALVAWNFQPDKVPAGLDSLIKQVDEPEICNVLGIGVLCAVECKL